MIRTINLTKKYKKKDVVSSISFDLNTGDYTAIVGPSGSGKTTLLSLIAGLIKPTSGDIFFENTQLNKMTQAQWATFRSHTLGLVFQFSELVPNLNVIENILLPGLFSGKHSKDEYIARANYLMERLDLRGMEQAMPMDLSGGQTQLVAIARSFINQPSVLLADEPSGDLDPAHANAIQSLFADYNKSGLTILLITHDMDLAFDAKNIYTMENGDFSSLSQGQTPSRRKK